MEIKKQYHPQICSKVQTIDMKRLYSKLSAGRKRTDSQTDEQRISFLELFGQSCFLVGSSATAKPLPGHIGAGWGQRGASKGAQHYTDASPTTMSHFRPLWFGLRGWPPASWSSLPSSYACSLHFLF